MALTGRWLPLQIALLTNSWEPKGWRLNGPRTDGSRPRSLCSTKFPPKKSDAIPITTLILFVRLTRVRMALTGRWLPLQIALLTNSWEPKGWRLNGPRTDGSRPRSLCSTKFPPKKSDAIPITTLILFVRLIPL
nr:hypothetical protein [Tanacetum cinerariifolium]